MELEFPALIGGAKVGGDHGMSRIRIKTCFLTLVVLILILCPNLLFARTGSSPGGKYSGGTPALSELDSKYHDVNDVLLAISNVGYIGLNVETWNGAGIFPSNTSNNYIFVTGPWFGAQYDADNDGSIDKVFVSTYHPQVFGSEFREGNNDQSRDDPLARVFDSMESEDRAVWPDRFYGDDPETGERVPFVIGDQDLVTTYTTKDQDPTAGIASMPIEVRQRSFAFRQGLAGQAIYLIFDVHHWGENVMKDAWVGYGSDMDVGVRFDDDRSSFIRDWVTPEGDTVQIDMAYAWDSDFTESNFTGSPGFVGITYLRSPGNPTDGIDNDDDGLVDESPFNGIDDDGDGHVDEADEVDELGLVNYSGVCDPVPPCTAMFTGDDPSEYDNISCNSQGSDVLCWENTTEPRDVRFMISSGPFDWQPGETTQIVMAMVFAHPTGDLYLPFDPATGRPDPNDDDLVELLAVKETVQWLLDQDFNPAEPPLPPNLTLVPGDGKVTLFWDDLPLRTPDPLYDAFVEIDPEYREFDFQGFRVWRSRTGEFSQLGDPDDPDYPLTPEAIQQNNDLANLDLTLLAQYDLADGIATDSVGITCEDSIVANTGDIIYTECDTFNLGTDTGLRYAYVDRGDTTAPLINGFRYYYGVTAYDYNSDALPVSRLSLDSGISFSSERSAFPRSNASSFVDAFGRLLHVDESGTVLDDTSSIFVDPQSGELDPVETVHASNALVDFAFTPGIPEKVSDDYYTLVLESFERINDITNRIDYYVEDATGTSMYTGPTPSFDLSYDGTDQVLSVAVFNPEDSSEVIFTSELTFEVDAASFVLPMLTDHFTGVSASGADITDSLGSMTIGTYFEAGYRGVDLEMEWITVDEAGDSLTLAVRDLDNLVEVTFEDDIVDAGAQSEIAKGSNWAFLPVGGGALQPGDRYFLTTAPVAIADLWVCGMRMTVTGMARMPQAGDVWTLRQLVYDVSVEIDTLISPPDTTITYLDAQRPLVPGTRYRLDTESGGQDMGSVDLTQIKVVPNPYLANAAWDIGPPQRRLEFINLPPECTIRIYTISGLLVRVLEHTSGEGGTEVYDLQTREGLSLASGNYYYHITTSDGQTHLGRFAVVQ